MARPAELCENHPQLILMDKHLLMDDYHCYLIKMMIYNDNLINTVLIFLLNSYALWLFAYVRLFFPEVYLSYLLADWQS